MRMLPTTSGTCWLPYAQGVAVALPVLVIDMRREAGSSTEIEADQKLVWFEYGFVSKSKNDAVLPTVKPANWMNAAFDQSRVYGARPEPPGLLPTPVPPAVPGAVCGEVM